MMRKLIVLFLLTLLTTAVFAGGTQDGGSSSGTDAAQPLSVNSMPIVDPPGSYTLSIAMQDTGFQGTSYNDNMAVHQRLQEVTGINLDWQVSPGGQWAQTVRIRLASGQDLPDLVRVPGTPGDAIRYADDGLILPLKDMINSYAPNIVKMFEEYPALKKGHIAPDGEIYFMANYITGLPNGLGVTIRMDWLDKLGLDMPETIDEWYTALKAFKENDLNGEGAGNIIPYGGHLDYFLSGFGMTSSRNQRYWYDGSGNVYFFAMHPRFKEYLTFLNKLYSEGLLDPMYGAGQSTIGQLRDQNRVAVATGWPGSQDVFDMRLLNLDVPDVNWIYALPPKDENGNHTLQVLNTCRNTSRWGITKDAKDESVVMRFLDYTYAAQDGVRLLHMGFEGEQWELVDGVAKFKDTMFNDPKYNYVAQLRLVGAFTAYMDSQSLEFNLARYQGKFVSGLRDIEAAAVAASYPVVTPTIDEQEKVINLSEDITSTIDEMTVLFVTGKEPLENFDKFINTLKGMGIEELQELYSQQYKRFLQG